MLAVWTVSSLQNWNLLYSTTRYFTIIHCVSKKVHPFAFCNN